MSATDYLENYKMDHEKRGYVVIINNKEFCNNKVYEPLLYQDKDVNNYIRTFENIGFKEIEVFENQTADQMKEIMKIYSENVDFTDCDCFIAVFLSHGYRLNNEQYIMGIDHGVMFKVNIKDLFTKTKSLYKKPKIFFMDVCRGDKDEPPFSKSADSKAEPTNCEDEKMSDSNISSTLFSAESGDKFFTNTDFFVGWASSDTFRAKIDEDGSWFSRTLCETINNNFQHMDLLGLDMKTRRIIKEKYKIQTSDADTTLMYRCFFTPKKEQNTFTQQKSTKSGEEKIFSALKLNQNKISLSLDSKSPSKNLQQISSLSGGGLN